MYWLYTRLHINFYQQKGNNICYPTTFVNINSDEVYLESDKHQLTMRIIDLEQINSFKKAHPYPYRKAHCLRRVIRKPYGS